MRNRRSGFTVIELLILVAILGILTALFAPIFMGRNGPKGSLESPQPAVTHKV